MANIEIEVSGRKYTVACRDGEEAHLQSVAALVDKRARDAAQALGNLGENRQLLFAALLLADDIKELKSGNASAGAPEPGTSVAEAVEALAERIEALADALESRAQNSGGLEERLPNA
jgi:cell division protein ZapA